MAPHPTEDPTEHTKEDPAEEPRRTTPQRNPQRNQQRNPAEEPSRGTPQRTPQRNPTGDPTEEPAGETAGEPERLSDPRGPTQIPHQQVCRTCRPSAWRGGRQTDVQTTRREMRPLMGGNSHKCPIPCPGSFRVHLGQSACCPPGELCPVLPTGVNARHGCTRTLTSPLGSGGLRAQDTHPTAGDPPPVHSQPRLAASPSSRHSALPGRVCGRWRGAELQGSTADAPHLCAFSGCVSFWPTSLLTKN